MGAGCGAGSKPAASDANAPADVDVDYKLIHSAVRWNKPIAEIEELIKSAAHANCQDEGNGNHPIHIAAQNGHLEALKLLVRKNAKLDATNKKMNTAVHMAIGYDYYDCAKFLIESGADLTIKNSEGFTGSYGLEGNKCLALAAFACADSDQSVTNAIVLMKEQIDVLKEIGKHSTTPKSMIGQIFMKLKKSKTLSAENEQACKEFIQSL